METFQINLLERFPLDCVSFEIFAVFSFYLLAYIFKEDFSETVQKPASDEALRGCAIDTFTSIMNKLRTFYVSFWHEPILNFAWNKSLPQSLLHRDV